MEFSEDSDGRVIPDPNAEPSEAIVAQLEAAHAFAQANAADIKRLKEAAVANGRTGADSAIVLIHVDDRRGHLLADFLMPGHDWQQYRDAGAEPIARGPTDKDLLVAFLSETGLGTAATELQSSDELMTVVLHSDMALVLDVRFDDDYS